MTRRLVFAANWKMNVGPSEARKYVTAFSPRFGARDDRSVVFFPSAISLTSVVHGFAARPDVGVGVQNISPEDKGAFTGETSAPMARDAGASFALVGHSERRHVFGETDFETGKKCAAAVRNGLTPILCVGELLSEREAGTTGDVVLRQLAAGIADLSDDAVASMAIAYEPVWAIGTGKNATPEDARAVHGQLRSALQSRIGRRATEVPVLYGGSVNIGNAKSLLAAQDVDGLLVGGASLDVDGWATICNT